VPTRHPYQLEPPGDAYLDCPVCAHIAPVEDADHELIADGQVDLSQAVVVRCAVCGYQTDGRPYARTRTHDHTCPRCHVTTRAPDWPSRAACSGCGLRYVPDAIKGTGIDAELYQIEQTRRLVHRSPTPRQ